MRRFSKARDGRRGTGGASDLASVNRRLAPGSIVAQLAFTSTAGGTYYLRDFGGPSRWISIRTNAPVHIVFGNQDVGAPTNSDPLFDTNDGWQDMIITPDITCLRLKGDSGSGSLTIMVGGPGSGIYGFVPLGAKLVLDLNADVGVTQTAGLVSAWADRSSYGNHVTQAVGANQPTLVANVLDGHSAIVFAGSHWLSRVPGFSGLPIAAQARVYMVAAYDQAFPPPGFPVMGTVFDVTIGSRIQIFSNGGHFATVRNQPNPDGVASSASTAGFGGSPALIDVWDDLVTSQIRINNVLGATSTASPGAMTRAMDRIVVGANQTFASNLTGRVVRLVIVNNPTAAENTYIYSRFKAEYPSLPI